ncbi:MAG: hypothetical protein RR431_01935 [Clostridia bacterium]
MKEINGTITLAYVEEDNKQRVIFRAVPLCTREGNTFHGSAEDFPDEGSLRIVPDKREQSTFKERMREIGGLCAVQLSSDGKELVKVRQNRNYAPDAGEKNQFAIYSDVICEFTQDGCFEVIQAGDVLPNTLTPQVLILKNKMLYGPVDAQEAATTVVEELKPFGNDRFLLHAIETPALGKHLVCWDPEATMNWRQRRSTLRSRERAAAQAAEPEASPAAQPLKCEPQATEQSKGLQKDHACERAKKATEPIAAKIAVPAAPPAAANETIESAKKQETVISQPKESSDSAKKQTTTDHVEQIRVEPRTRRVERAAEILKQEEEVKKTQHEAADATKEHETVLPIGTRLDILDTEMPFDQQISRLAQPLSESANRLTGDAEEPQEEPEETVSHFFGTPLTHTPVRLTRTAVHPDPVHHVVEQQMRHQRDDVMGAEIGSGAYHIIDNPIDNLQSSVEYVWQNVDMRQQSISMLMQNESFVSDMVNAFRRGGINLQASAAAQEQLSEIEAERLSLLMQLETAKNNEKNYREAAIASLAQKRRDEVERLKRDIADLQDAKKKLSEAASVLSTGTAEKVTEFLATRMSCLSGAGEQRVLLAPVMGNHFTQPQLLEALRKHMNERGFSLSEDEATGLLIHFALCDALCFRAQTVQDAKLFADVLVESLGLQSVSAVICPGAYVEMISLLPENNRRTPTITIQPAGTETMSVFGHKTLFLADAHTVHTSGEAMYPVIDVPPMSKCSKSAAMAWVPASPAALSSFTDICADAKPMLKEAEKWFASLKQDLHQANCNLPEAILSAMYAFIEVASGKVRGGFLSAADTAVCHWLIPLLTPSLNDPSKLSAALGGLPRTMNKLGIL